MQKLSLLSEASNSPSLYYAKYMIRGPSSRLNSSPPAVSCRLISVLCLVSQQRSCLCFFALAERRLLSAVHPSTFSPYVQHRSRALALRIIESQAKSCASSPKNSTPKTRRLCFLPRRLVLYRRLRSQFQIHLLPLGPTLLSTIRRRPYRHPYAHPPLRPLTQATCWVTR
jgi:hypothetical protein